ncbi:MAG: hypothetical protein HY712_04190 [candidate division NC10 bacterium]|nr:hypothetical protein [candidate division NC10 bacterium]
MRRRPSPEQVQAILHKLFQTQASVSLPDLVAAIRHDAEVSRATAYRAATDALEAGVVGFEESGD